MPMTANPPTRISQLRATARAMLDGLSERDMRRQPHVELSPMLWHVGHVFFVENYWLAEQVFGDRRVTDAWRTLYFPAHCPKETRSTALPDVDTLLAWTHAVSADNDRYWAQAAEHEHPLLTDGYLHAFVRQHYGQHLETMRLVACQLALANKPPAAQTVPCEAPHAARVAVAAQHAAQGSDAIEAYDNEQPPVIVPIRAFEMAPSPVTNAQWAGFMAERGYNRPELWDDAGWHWRKQLRITHPQHWAPGADGQWSIPGLRTASAAPDEPVHGISWYEARAFARYAQARLPAECEWEAARRADLLGGVDQVWEWCNDAFAPYPGFRAFPYHEYSQAWFDGAHFVARGASVHTEADVRRPSFRNFYPPTHRHIHAGLRLAW